MNIIKTEYYKIESFRLEYLETLPKFQDYFLELMVEDADYYLITKDGFETGYAIKTTDNVLIELFLKDESIPQGLDFFLRLLKELSIKRIYCKSFDALLLNLCTRLNFPYKVIGALYRNISWQNENYSYDLEHRFAEESDMEFLLGQEDETFEPKHKIPSYIRNKSILMFYKEGFLAGCGFISRVHPDWKYYDLGVWVVPEFRKKGIGTQIISFLKNMCMKNRNISICGCDINNTASQKTLEKCGFISRYNLLEFTL